MSLNRSKLFKSYFSKSTIGGTVSINDLKEKDFSGQVLSDEEKQALQNYDLYRISVLNKVSGSEFHEKYRQMQVLANLEDYTEFLKEKYNV